MGYITRDGLSNLMSKLYDDWQHLITFEPQGIQATLTPQGNQATFMPQGNEGHENYSPFLRLWVARVARIRWPLFISRGNKRHEN